MKKIKIHVTLTDFKKRIYRKFEILDDLDLASLCETIIYSFNGDLSHLYALTGKNIEFSYSGYEEYELKFNNFKYANANKKIKLLELTKGEKLKLSYDFGDNWQFLITVSSVEEIEKNNGLPLFKVLNGKGLGIVEDCGGLWGLDNLIYRKQTCEKNGQEYLEEDIDEFDLEKQKKYTIYRH